MGYERSKVIDLAVSELNYHEKATNARLDDKTANSGSGNWTKYARDLDALGDFYNGPKNGYAWCDIFYDWLLYKCFGEAAAKKLLCQPDYSAGAGCYYSALYYKQHGQFFTSDPKPGDQIFFTYRSGEVSHTGLVVSVVESTVNTIEGNTSDGVYRRSYQLGNGTIYGYGRPKWDMEEVTAPQPMTPTDGKTVDELAREVIAGLWGIGTERIQKLTAAGHDYAAVQARVNAILSGADTEDAPPATVQEPTPAPTLVGYAVWLEEISEGSTGNTVKAVQTLLIARGYSCGGDIVNGHEVADGDFGPTTRKAVEAFQKANGLTADGTVGDKTMAALLK